MLKKNLEFKMRDIITLGFNETILLIKDLFSRLKKKNAEVKS
jgi:hypothetical protein